MYQYSGQLMYPSMFYNNEQIIYKHSVVVLIMHVTRNVESIINQ